MPVWMQMDPLPTRRPSPPHTGKIIDACMEAPGMRQMAVLTLAPRGLAAAMDDRWGGIGGKLLGQA